MGQPKLPSLNQVLNAKSGGGQKGLPSLDEVLAKKPAAATPKKSGGGGFLGEVGHLAKQTGADLYDTAIHSPSGLFHLGVAVTKATHGDPGPLVDIAKATGKGYAADFSHPLRHPGNTLLDLSAAVSLGAGTAARVGEVGRVAEAGGSASSLVRAAVKGPADEARVLKYGGGEVQAGKYSRTASRRAAQKLFDEFQQRFPDVRLPLRNLHERVGNELKRDRNITDAIGRAPAHVLAKMKLSPSEQKALQVVAEGVPVQERIAFHQQQLGGLKGKLAAATRKEITLLKSSQRYVHDVNGMPRILPEHDKLVHAFEAAKGLAHQREDILYGTDRLARSEDGTVNRVQALNDGVAAGRLTSPAGVIRGGAHGFDPNLVPELFRFPYATKKALPALGKIAGYKGGTPRTPGTLTHEFTGALLKSGAFRNDTSKLVAESYLEAHRFSALMRHRDEFLQLAHDTRETAHDIPIRTDGLLNRQWPKVLQDLSEKPALTKTDLETLGHFYTTMQEDAFPKLSDLEAELAKGEHPQVKWIDERVLGGLNKPNPLVGFTGGAKKGLTVFDSINNASRAAILYLKPAYAVPNILGNEALSIVHQGWGHPVQIARSVRLFHKLSPELRAKVKLAMGEGVTGSLHTEAGPLSKSINRMAELWQTPVDTPFRLNAFLYEARKAGYKTPAGIEKLFGNDTELLKVARESNAALIDYGRLGKFEQDVIRRVIFFYPWVKGSSVYAGRFLVEHPNQTALAGQFGKQGAAQDQADLGALPSYAEGLFKVGERGGNPLVVNPTSAGVLQTPAQLGKAFAELASSHPGEAFQLAQNLTPAMAASLALLTNYGARRGQSPVANAENQLVGGIPALVTGQQLVHPPSESTKPRVYPRDRRDVLLHFLLGGLAPAPLNEARAHASKYREDHPR